MTKSTPSHWVTAVSEISAEDIYIRGYAMRALVGRLPFTAIAFLLLRNRLPSPGEAKMMDVLLSAILDYGLQKSGTLAARAVVSVNPQMTAGLAAGVLAAGDYAVSPQATGTFIVEALARRKTSGGNLDTFADAYVAELRAARKRVPGFGHPVFRGTDPRSEKLKAFALEFGVWGEANELYEAIHRAFQRAAAKPDLVLNDVGMLAAIMVQMGFTPKEMEGIAVLSTFPGLIAHVSEELESGAINRMVPDSHVDYTAPRRDLAADMAASGW